MELCKILTNASTLTLAELPCTILRHAETSVPTETAKFISNNATVTFRELQRCSKHTNKDGGIVRWLVVNWDQTKKQDEGKDWKQHVGTFRFEQVTTNWSHVQIPGQCTGTESLVGSVMFLERTCYSCFHSPVSEVNSHHPSTLITRFRHGHEVKNIVTISAQVGESQVQVTVSTPRKHCPLALTPMLNALFRRARCHHH